MLYMLFLNKPENLIKIVQVYRQKGHSRPLNQCQKLSTQGRKCNCFNKSERLDPAFILHMETFGTEYSSMTQIMLVFLNRLCYLKFLKAAL